VYEIAVHTKDFANLARSIIANRSKDISFIPAVRHGILNEEICRRRYVTEKAASKLFLSYKYDKSWKKKLLIFSWPRPQLFCGQEAACEYGSLQTAQANGKELNK
jgi:hypothetical protein